MSLPSCGADPGAYRDGADLVRDREAHRRMVEEELKPLQVMTRKPSKNVIVAAAALGGLDQLRRHFIAIAAMPGVELDLDDWQRSLCRAAPRQLSAAGEYLGEGFHKAGGRAAVLGELLAARELHARRSPSPVAASATTSPGDAARPESSALGPSADARSRFLVMTRNLFHSAIMKTR